MKIGIIGGTGKEGSGLAIRWARAGHDVLIGSRDGDRGRERAAELSGTCGVTIHGGSNEQAVAHAALVVLSVPYGAHRSTLEPLREALQGKSLLDITVPLAPPRVREVHLPAGQAAALEAAALLGEGVQVVAGFHHVSSAHLADLDHDLETDVLVVGDDPDLRAAVIGLVADLGGRGIDAGALRNAIALESLTPVLLHINRHYKSPGAGIRITGIETA